jgi:transcriptional regulator with XRE-family HTH domain
MEKKELLTKFGLNVKIERIKKGLNQEQFADIVGIHRNYLSKIENGEVNMSLGKILELANSLNVDINALLRINL